MKLNYVVYFLYHKGPFATFHVRQDFAECEWSNIKFSPDGKLILISTNISQIRILDAFQGNEIATLSVSILDYVSIFKNACVV